MVSEAEYAFESQKHIIPLKLQKGYKPDGWLGFLLGSKYFYDLTKEEPVFSEKLKALLTAIRKAMDPSGAVVVRQASQSQIHKQV
jgi:hypothetical protein